MYRRNRDCDPPPEHRDDPEDSPTVDLNTPRYWYEGECHACGEFRPLKERDLCLDCDRRFDRDLVRLRHWSFCGLAAELTEAEREALRNRIIGQHGEALELIALEGIDTEGSECEPEK